MNDPVTTTRSAGGAMLPETLHALQKLHPVCLGQSPARAPLIIAVLARPDTWKASCAQIISDWR